MPLQATSGAASYDAFGGGVPVIPYYIEDMFSTYLYTGNSTTGGTQTITNNIDLSTKGGMVWVKGRSAASDHILTDTARGAGTTASNNQALASNLTTAEDLAASYDFLSAFNTTGFAVTQGGTTAATRGTNYNAVTYASWTFREQPKFFDIVTYTGTGSARTVAHNLGSVPGCIIIKRTTSTATSWAVYHRSLGNTKFIKLNTTAAESTSATYWNDTDPTSTEFTVATNNEVNTNGETYVAYIFAHDAGNFGLTGTDNVISCGSFTTDGSGNATVTLGYEPQWMLLKKSSGTAASWTIVDSMRGLVSGSSTTTSDDATLNPNNSNAEGINNVGRPTATGFEYGGSVASQTFIYIAIRRGPMKVPTDATKVFEPVAITGDSTSRVVTNSATFPIDAVLIGVRSGDNKILGPRLTGEAHLLTNSTDLETLSDFPSNPYPYMNGILVEGTGGTNQTGNTYVYEMFRRAPSFFDVVCYTGTGSATTFNHNLGVVPELMIVKRRDTANAWAVYANNDNTDYLVLNTSAATADDNTYWNDTSPTSSLFSVGTNNAVNASASTYVAYLFATCAGVSKVGTYTGNGTTQTIDCGFGAGGARFVLIKRTDAAGDWYFYDTARGMTVLTDPYLRLNNATAEVATLGSVTTVSTGFALNSAILAAINVSAASYIFLAIA